ncbi:MAG: hypothetical protein ACRC1P_00375 [Cellulosilyticaceae bacterium]
MVKRYYDTSIRYLLGEGALFIVLFILGIVAGSLYAIYVRDNSMLFFTINQYLTLDYEASSKLEVVKDSLWIYGKNLALIWAGGLFNMTLAISSIIFFSVCFSYGFTTSCFILIYGLKGIVVSLMAYGIQAIIIIFTGLCVGNIGIRYSIYKQMKGIEEYARALILVMIGAGSAAMLDAYLQPLMQKLICYLL